MGGPSRALLLQGPLLGPLISVTGSKKMAVMWWWKPFKQEDVAFLNELIEAGNLAPVIDRAYSLSEVPAALRYLEEGHARWKVVISIASPRLPPRAAQPPRSQSRSPRHGHRRPSLHRHRPPPHTDI